MQCGDERLHMFNDACYLVVNYPEVTWPTAQQICRGMKALLASIVTPEEGRFITTIIRKNSEYRTNALYWLVHFTARDGLPTQSFTLRGCIGSFHIIYCFGAIVKIEIKGYHLYLIGTNACSFNSYIKRNCNASAMSKLAVEESPSFSGFGNYKCLSLYPTPTKFYYISREHSYGYI